MNKRGGNRKPLTDRQMEIYEFIRKEIVENSCTPSVRAIGKEFGIGSPNAVADHIEQLTRKGWLRRSKKYSRHLELLPIKQVEEFSIMLGEKIQIGDLSLTVSEVNGNVIGLVLETLDTMPERRHFFATLNQVENFSHK